MLLVVGHGAITALGDTIFPVKGAEEAILEALILRTLVCATSYLSSHFSFGFFFVFFLLFFMDKKFYSRHIFSNLTIVSCTGFSWFLNIA